MKRRIFFIILTIAAIAAWYGYIQYNRTTPNLTDAKPSETIMVQALLTAFEHDSATAAKQYDDKVIAVSGTIKKMETEGNPVIIFLGDAAQMSSVQCSMDSTNAQNYKRLKTGMATTLKGQVTGFRTDPLFGTDVILARCVVANNP